MLLAAVESCPDARDGELDQGATAGEHSSQGRFDDVPVSYIGQIAQICSNVVGGAAEGRHGEVGRDGQTGKKVIVGDFNEALGDFEDGNGRGGHGLRDTDAGQQRDVEFLLPRR